MAEARAQDVVIEAQSMGGSPIDVSGNTLTSNGAGDGEERPSVAVDAPADSALATPPLTAHSHSTSEDASLQPDATQPDGFSSFAKFDDSQRTLSPSNAKSHVESDNRSTAEASLINGVDSASFAGSEDTGYQNLLGTDDSVASDTDITRTDGAEPTLEPTLRRERSNSVKKPASFKAVSVTKNFLAKSGGSPSPLAKLGGDRTSTTTPSSAAVPQAQKPRLVAKTGRDARTLTTGNGVATSNGPDASTVWNRNRPAPAPTPKQFTDEELKQQYGIHMATRLQADEAGGQSKWADIDDDEDDWAPETVQWMDGTKSTLLPSENQPTPPPKTTGSSQPLKDPNEAPSSAAPPSQSQTSISSIGKTILRPGARVVATNQTKPGLILRSVPENPARQDTPQGSSSSKSPWAPLPPVDKASPITFYPPTNTSGLQPMTTHRQDLSAQDEETHVISPAREIAADDFDRSWRESGDRPSRELFNSQSGRYEPVKNVRRSSRQEQGFRPPSVLQRPSQQGPAEPSAAFQSRETRSWSQRRDSSSLGGYERRVSMDHEIRPSAQTIKGPSPHASPPKGDANLAMADSQIKEQYETSGIDKQNVSSVQAPEQNQTPAVPDQDPRLVQQQLMRERIERNRKRKQEEEAREEAERKERIRLKMAALGPVSPSVAQSKPVEPNEAESKTAPPAGSEPDSRTVTSSTKDIDTAQKQAESQPQIEALKASAASEPLSTTRSQLSPSKSTVEQGAKSSPPSGGMAATNSAEVPLPGLGHPMPDRQARSWGRTTQSLESSNNWSNKSLAQGPSSVWGPPASDRPLGNGAFESEVNRMPSIQLPPSHQIAPGPLRPASMSPRTQFDSANSVSSPPAHMQNSTGLSPNVSSRASFQQSPIRPPNDAGFQRQIQQAPADMGAAKRAWQNFPTQVANDDAALKEQADRDWATKVAEEERIGSQAEHQPIFRETFRQTVPSDILGQRRVVSVTKAVQDGHNQAAYGQRSSNSQATPPLQQTTNGRASRFFGPSADRLPLVASGLMPEEELLISVPASPPPPETAEHPVHGLHNRHPLVNIPKVLKVKLPPAPNATSTHRQEVVQMPQLGKFRSGPQPLVNQIAWQDRFNGLFGRTSKTTQPVMTAPPTITSTQGQSPNIVAAPISSSTKATFDEPRTTNATTVSLPYGVEQSRSPSVLLDVEEQNIETKPTEEELLDEREFGSSPTVRLFKGIHPREEVITSNCPSFHHGLVGNSQISYFEKANKEFPASANALSFEYLDQDYFQSSGTRIRIRISGKPTTVKILPRKAVAHGQVRKPKPRNPIKKQHVSGKVTRSANGVANQQQEGSGNGGSRIGAGSKPSPRLEGQSNTRQVRASGEVKKTDDYKAMTTSSGNLKHGNTPQEGSSGEVGISGQSERPKTGSQWAKPPKSQRRPRHNPIQA